MDAARRGAAPRTLFGHRDFTVRRARAHTYTHTGNTIAVILALVLCLAQGRAATLASIIYLLSDDAKHRYSLNRASRNHFALHKTYR